MVDLTFFGQCTNLLDQSPSEQELVADVLASISRLCRDCCVKARLAGVEGERDAAVRSQSNNGQRPCHQWPATSASGGDKPDAQDKVYWKLSEWLQSEELGEAFVVGNENRVMELSSRLSGGAARLSELMGVMVLGGHGPWAGQSDVGDIVDATGEATHPGPKKVSSWVHLSR